MQTRVGLLEPSWGQEVEAAVPSGLWLRQLQVPAQWTLPEGLGVAVSMRHPGQGGVGRVRADALNILFVGSSTAAYSQGFQPIIIPPPTQAVSLAIQSVAGVAARDEPIRFAHHP